MLKFEERFDAWKVLGEKLAGFVNDETRDSDEWSMSLLQKVNVAVHHNGWFEKDQVMHALSEWAQALSESSLNEWVGRYSSAHFHSSSPKRVGIIMAGNVPMVGLHDLLTVTMTGHRAIVKLSSDDNQLIPALLQGSPILEQVEWADMIKSMDAVIATGSDNTARYFEAYFGKYPHVIRKNRKSVAILTGEEDEATLKKLGEDVFRYFGLGCRSVSKIYLPKDFDLDRIFGAWLPYQDVVQNNKYANNYDYHRAIMLLDRKEFLENGFVTFKESDVLSTPVSMIHYERYNDLDNVYTALAEIRDSIQCIVTNEHRDDLPAVGFGQSQSPALWDYADGVDTVEFLKSSSSV